MKDDGKTKKQVVGELEAMRQRIAELDYLRQPRVPDYFRL
jgi:hypothetical protein